MRTFSHPFEIFFALSVETFHTYELRFVLIFDRAALDRHTKCFHSSWTPHISSTPTLPFLHAPFPFQSFELAKYRVFFLLFPNEFKKKCPKCLLHGDNDLCFGKQDNKIWLSARQLGERDPPF
jgi:hypothetical protein